MCMDNTVGSLNPFQRSVVMGSLLGDGYLRRVSGRRNAFLEINHSIAQRAYVDWLYDVLRPFSAGAPRSRGGNGARVAYRFTTKQHDDFTQLMKMFYHNKKKIIPFNLRLDPIMLAVWYMDDGSMCRLSDVYLNTQQFSDHEQRLLVHKLYELGICASVNKDKTYQRIRLKKASVPILLKLLAPYVIPSMHYKLHRDPVETTRRSPHSVVQRRVMI